MFCSLGVLGAFTLALILKEPAMIIYRLFRAPKDMTKYGKWAVVTGATDGIGKAVAMELARKGMSILLISRTESKLVDTKKEIKDACPGVDVEHIAIDFGAFDDAKKAAVATRVKGLDGGVGVLVNNVGMSYSFPKFFHELDDSAVASLVDLNINSTLGMTRIVLPAMVERKSGCVVNISSGSSLSACPLLAQYAAAKTFINSLTASLAAEYESKGVHFQSQVPLFVTTKLAKIRHPSLTTPTPKGFAKASVASMGYERLVSPYWCHALILWVLSLLPSIAIDKIMMGTHLPLRKRGLKKEADKAREASN